MSVTEICLQEITETYDLKITKKFNMVICRLTTQSGYTAFGVARIPIEKTFIKNIGKKLALAQAWKHFTTPIKVNIEDKTGNPILENS